MKRFVSIITTAYNEQDSILPLYEQLIHNIKKSNNISKYEILFVDDGSTDETNRKIHDVLSRDKNTHIIHFQQNKGKSNALQAGFDAAKGDVVITLDADLQDDPKELDRFIEKTNEGYDLVSGYKVNRKDSLEKIVASKIFNFVVSSLFGIRLHDHNCGYKAYTKELAHKLHIHGDLHRFIPCIAHHMGYSVTEIEVNHRKREFGHSKYGLARYLVGFADTIKLFVDLKIKKGRAYEKHS